jgi:hypothetical protein
LRSRTAKRTRFSQQRMQLPSLRATHRQSDISQPKPFGCFTWVELTLRRPAAILEQCVAVKTHEAPLCGIWFQVLGLS